MAYRMNIYCLPKYFYRWPPSCGYSENLASPSEQRLRLPAALTCAQHEHKYFGWRTHAESRRWVYCGVGRIARCIVSRAHLRIIIAAACLSSHCERGANMCCCRSFHVSSNNVPYYLRLRPRRPYNADTTKNMTINHTGMRLWLRAALAYVRRALYLPHNADHNGDDLLRLPAARILLN